MKKLESSQAIYKALKDNNINHSKRALHKPCKGP